jgi:hypothetical protein
MVLFLLSSDDLKVGIRLDLPLDMVLFLLSSDELKVGITCQLVHLHTRSILGSRPG